MTLPYIYLSLSNWRSAVDTCQSLQSQAQRPHSVWAEGCRVEWCPPESCTSGSPVYSDTTALRSQLPLDLQASVSPWHWRLPFAPTSQTSDTHQNLAPLSGETSAIVGRPSFVPAKPQQNDLCLQHNAGSLRTNGTSFPACNEVGVTTTHFRQIICLTAWQTVSYN